MNEPSTNQMEREEVFLKAIADSLQGETPTLDKTYCRTEEWLAYIASLIQNGSGGGGTGGTTDYNKLTNKPITNLTGTEESPIYLRDLETGGYVLNGNCSPYNGSETYMGANNAVTFVNHFDTVTAIQIFYPPYNQVQYFEIYDDSYTTNIVALNEMSKRLSETTPYYFDNVASMKSANLKVGDYAKTTGYYEVNDGGGAEYIIADDSTLVDDGGSVHDLANGLKAKLIVKDSVNVKQFGAKGDGETDDTVAIQNTINYAQGEEQREDNSKPGKINVVKFHTAIYVVSSMIFVPWSVSIKGNDATIKVAFDGFAFGLNTKDGTTWAIAYPNVPKNYIENLFFINKDSSTYTKASAIKIASGSIIRNIRTMYMYRTVSQIQSYVDNKEIRNLTTWNGIGDCDVNLLLGDGLVIENCFDTRLKITDCGGATINSNTNGTLSLNSCRAIEINGWHKEAGEAVYFYGSDVTMNGGYFYKTTDAPLFTIGDVNNYKGSNVIMNNCTFEVLPARYTYTADTQDISVTKYSKLILNNVHRNLSDNSGHTGLGSSLNINGSIIHPIYTHYVVYTDGKIQNEANLYVPSNNYFNTLLGSIIPTTEISGIYMNGDTYNFKMSGYFDTTRLIKFSRNAWSIDPKTVTVTEDNSSLKLNISSNLTTGYLRIYKGTSDGVYNQYVDVPISGNKSDHVYDNGKIGGIYEYEEFDGTVDSGIASTTYKSYPNGTVKIDGSSIPSKGTWTKGDIIINSNPTAGSIYGWMCIESGTPGTWKTIGTIGE